MTTPGNRITCRILEFVLLAGLILAIPVLARLDIQVFVHGHS